MVVLRGDAVLNRSFVAVRRRKAVVVLVAPKDLHGREAEIFMGRSLVPAAAVPSLGEVVPSVAPSQGVGTRAASIARASGIAAKLSWIV